MNMINPVCNTVAPAHVGSTVLGDRPYVTKLLLLALIAASGY